MKLNHWLWRIAAALLLVAVGRQILAQLNSKSNLAEIKRRGVLRVGLDASFPPFESLDEAGQVTGLDADLARAIAADLGVETQFITIGFDGLYEALAVGRVDVLLSGLPVDPARTGEVAYSVSYFNAGQALVTTRPDIQSVDDLAGQEVAVEWGSLADMEARRLSQTIPGLRLAPHPDAATAMQSAIAVVDGVSALSNPRLRLVAYLSDTPYAAAVTVQNKELLAQVNRTFTRLIEGGEMARLQQKWLAVN